MQLAPVLTLLLFAPRASPCFRIRLPPGPPPGPAPCSESRGYCSNVFSNSISTGNQVQLSSKFRLFTIFGVAGASSASSLLKASTSDSSLLYNHQYNQATKTACARWCWKHNTMNTDKCVIWSYASRSRRCTLYRRCFMIRSWFRLHLVSGTPKCGEGGEFKKACLLEFGKPLLRPSLQR